MRIDNDRRLPTSLLALTGLLGATLVAIAVHGGSATTVPAALGAGIGAAGTRAALVWFHGRDRHLFPLTLTKRVALVLTGFTLLNAVGALGIVWTAFWVALVVGALVMSAYSWDIAVGATRQPPIEPMV